MMNWASSISRFFSFSSRISSSSSFNRSGIIAIGNGRQGVQLRRQWSHSVEKTLVWREHWPSRSMMLLKNSRVCNIQYQKRWNSSNETKPKTSGNYFETGNVNDLIQQFEQVKASVEDPGFYATFIAELGGHQQQEKLEQYYEEMRQRFPNLSDSHLEQAVSSSSPIDFALKIFEQVKEPSEMLYVNIINIYRSQKKYENVWEFSKKLLDSNISLTEHSAEAILGSFYEQGIERANTQLEYAMEKLKQHENISYTELEKIWKYKELLPPDMDPKEFFFQEATQTLSRLLRKQREKGDLEEAIEILESYHAHGFPFSPELLRESLDILVENGSEHACRQAEYLLESLKAKSPEIVGPAELRRLHALQKKWGRI